MANKRLSLENIELMKAMVVRGTSPEDIAKHFDIAISSVHNYKKRFKELGLKFPDVRGKRPSGTVDVLSVTPVSSAPVKNEIKNDNSVTTAESKLNFVVNGVNIQITGETKNVTISNNGIKVDF